MYLLDGLEGKDSPVDNEKHSTIFLKMFFLRNLFTWVTQNIEINSTSLLDFVEWLGSCKVRVLFLSRFLCY